MLSAMRNCARMVPDAAPPSDEIPALIRAELNADRDRDVLARVRYLARKKRMLEPEITDEEMADYLALAENFQNFAQWLSARRGGLERPLRARTAWAMATFTILGVLTAMMIMAIAIAV
jgi:hypothetical protein